MSSTSAYAAYNPTIGNYQPYLTVTEYNNAPTAIDTSNLIAGGVASVQTAALAEVIGRISSWIDGYVMGSAYGTLNATSNIENGRIWGSNMNTLIVHPRYWPILEVQSFQYSTLGQPGNSASISPANNIWIEPQEFIVTPGGTVGLGLNAPPGISTGIQYYCQWQYVNGFPNTTLSASVASGSASVSVVNPMGIYPNSLLTLFDMPYDEDVTVASTYTPGGNVIPLTSSLSYEHGVGSTLTNLPKAVKQAAISATTAFVKMRGSGALMVADMGAVTKEDVGFAQGGDLDLAEAEYLLDPLRQLFMGY